jgi:UDP-N-acetyl-D-glucosamine dehydrogenase
VQPATDRSVAIIGLGYSGLPLAVSLVEAGLEVAGIDANLDRVSALSAGRSPVDDISDERLASALAGGMSVVGPGGPELEVADVVFVCVPTPIDQSKDPDLGPVIAAGRMICASLRPGQLVVLQSTTYPGTTTGRSERSSSAAA